VRRLLDGVADAVGDQLVGLYLHGSLALGDFFPPASDVDFHVATAASLGQPALERIGAMHAAFKAEGGWVARLEGVYLPPGPLRRLDPAAERCPTVGSDWDFGPGRPGPTWVLDRWVTREHGVVVTGPDPRELLDPIGPGELRAAVRASMLGHWAERVAEGADLAWLRPRGYQAFAILTMCRDPVCAGARGAGVQAGGGRLGGPAAGAAVAGHGRAGPGLAGRRAPRRPAPARDPGPGRDRDRTGQGDPLTAALSGGG